jgi:hypothetical protein
MISEAITVIWRKSSFSGQDASNGACVEVAFVGPAVAVRDSKSPGTGMLSYPEWGWAAFVTTCSRRAELR